MLTVPMTDFKDEREHTLADSIKVLKRVMKLVKPYGYSPSILGSTVLEGKGRDIDLHVMGNPSRQVIPPLDLAMLIIMHHAKHIYLWHTEQVGDCMDIVIVWETHDKLYIDMHIKGVS